MDRNFATIRTRTVYTAGQAKIIAEARRSVISSGDLSGIVTTPSA
jgi:hypothetical protein